MIIGVDASQANREVRSGTEWYAFYLIRELVKLTSGHTVRLYFRDQPRPDLIQGLPANVEIKVLKWPFKYFWAQGRLSLEMLFHPPDVLFSPAHTIPVIHPQHTFTTLHDLGFEEFPELYDKLSLWYHRFSAKLAVKRAKHIFTISNFTKGRIVKLYNCPPEKITVTYLAYDKEKFKPLPREQVEPVLNKYNLKYKNYLLFIGRIEPKKNIEGLIKAYNLISSPLTGEDKGEGDDIPELVLAGPIINPPKISNPKVRLLGYIDEADKPALYNGAAVFVFPTFYEGFGMPIIEAQACGVPVVTSNTTSNPEVAGPAGEPSSGAGDSAVIVDPCKPEEIAEAISDLLDNESYRRRLVQKGFANIKRFDWQQTAWKTLDSLIGLKVSG